jgi:uncharacterized protein (TIGR01777 family)
MKIVIPGGSGRAGTILARHFRRRGDEVVVLSRRAGAAGTPWRTIVWDAVSLGPWAGEIDGADVVINLAGRSVNCRFNAANRREIMDSRIGSTRAVGNAIARAARPPRLWLQASTATIYAHRFDAPNDEATGIIGGGPEERGAPDAWKFSVDVAQAWERELDAARTPGTRRIAMRSAMVMSPDKGGVFDTLATLTKRGFGGNAAGGGQYVSWIHEADFVRAVEFLIAHEQLAGPVNICSPNPLPYAEFVRALRRAMGVRIALPATRLMLEIGAILMRTETELILKSRRVVPARLLEAGFEFAHPDWPAAAAELVGRWRARA